jgi:hypothetical protein
MEVAVENYHRYRRSEHAWMLGAFVLPAARLPEFLRSTEAFSGEIGDPWPLSLLVSTPVAPAVERAEALLGGRPFRIAAIECRSEDLAADAASLPAQLDAFFELKPDAELGAAVETLAASGRYAKIRTGSVRADEIPPSSEVAGFLDACALRRLPFKATAGLHHPLRSEHPLSYEADAPRGTMHGFLNVFLASVLRANSKLDRAQLETFIDAGSLGALELTDDSLRVAGQTLRVEDIAAGRRFARSFGSCSFEEPIEDLRRMGWL